MKVLIINSVCGTGSTGRICTSIADEYIQQGHECRIAFGRKNTPERYKDIAYRIGTEMDVRLHIAKSRLTDKHGLGSVKATKKFLKWAEEYDPDILWLHNIHGYYINCQMLFDWIKSRPQMNVKWTLHDCWAFTGHCSYFTMNHCDKWKLHCEKCIQKREYPASIFFDRSYSNFEWKKAAFCNVKKMLLITPSKWLADLVKQSFLKEYTVKVVNNKIDTNIFKPTISDFREKNNLTEKKIILGVANIWSERKGLLDFIKLSKKLDDNCRIILVGLSQKQIDKLPSNIIGFQRTESQQELAALYTCADLFVNPSYEETFGLTTAEAISCGTKAIVYKGSACEEICDLYGGISVEPDVDSLYQSVVAELYS